MDDKNQIENPIQYFEDLIYYKNLLSIKKDFAHIDEQYELHVSYDEDTETLIYHEQNQETGEWEEWTDSFEDFLNKKVTNEAIQALKKIDILLLNQDSFDKKTELATSLIDNLSFLLESLKKFPEANKYKIVEKRVSNIIAHINSKHSRLIGKKISPKHKSITYVSLQRIEELSQIKSSQFDLSKLIRMLEELNIAYLNEAYISCGILVRAVLDHIPQILGHPNFKTLASQISGKTNKKLMNNLEGSSRKIADSLLHSPIKRNEILPTEVQIDSKRELDVLIGEIIRKLK